MMQWREEIKPLPNPYVRIKDKVKDKDKTMDIEHNAQLLEMLNNGTDKQRESYETLSQNWDNVGTPSYLIGDGQRCWMVEVSSDDTGAKMWLGIEPDGYTHS